MKVQQPTLDFLDQDSCTHSSHSTSTITSPSSSSLALSIKCLRRLSSKFSAPKAPTTLHLDSRSRKPDASPVPLGSTRWNPTQEQIHVLEAMYSAGMRTPDAGQIEKVTSELKRYGSVEGKNVFYWFQNHKARERQRQKRNALLAVAVAPSVPAAASPRSRKGREEHRDDGSGSCKRKCKTLDLFPLHPEMGK